MSGEYSDAAVAEQTMAGEEAGARLGGYDPATDDELLEPDQVQPAPARGPTPEQLEVLDRATAHVLATPGIPGRDEFLAIAAQARILSMSSAVPKALRDKPHDTFLVMLIGRDLGIPLTLALLNIDVIDGTPSLNPKLLNARCQQLGLGAIRPGPKGEGWASAVAYGPDGQPLGEPFIFDWADAQDAGLVRHDCLGPRAHSDDCKRKALGNWDQRKQACKDNWRHYPQRMLWWRAAGYVADDYFPQAGLGLYSPDELGAMMDADGKVIDPRTVELPEGYEPPELPPDGSEAADLDTLQGLHVSLLALPPDVQAEAKERWREKLPPIGKLTAGQARTARALLGGFQSQARKVDGWQAPAAEAEVRAMVEAGELRLVGQEAVPDADGPTEPEQVPDVPPAAPEAVPDAPPADPTTDVPMEVLQRLANQVTGMAKPEVRDQLLEAGVEPEGTRVEKWRQQLASVLLDRWWREQAEPEPDTEPTTDVVVYEDDSPFTDPE